MSYIKSATQVEIDEVRARVDFQVYFERHVIPVYPEAFHYGDFISNGGKAGCPLHGETNPSFHIRVWEDGVQTFKCFGCNLHGDIIKFHMYFSEQYEGRNLNYYQSAKELYDEFISGKIVKTKNILPKIKLKSDAPVDVSSLMEQANFYLKYNKYEKNLINKKVDFVKLSEYYVYVDKIYYLVKNNLLNATEASKCIDEAYNELDNIGKENSIDDK